ncbi:MAG: flagellar motor switch protein FliN [Fibrobacter sp.]|nr:flagellar motor switch protein FliN [Fibrobacter sp.]
MSDILSQEQIDALLSSENLDSSSVSGLDSASAPQSDIGPALKTFINSFCGHAGTIVSTVLNTDTMFIAEESRKADLSSLEEIVGQNGVLLTIMVKSGIVGQFHLLMRKGDVAVISDLMLMGDGTAQYNDDHREAMNEMINQVINAFENASVNEVGVKISGGSVSTSDLDLSILPEPLATSLMVPVTVSVGEKVNSAAVLYFSSSFADAVAAAVTVSSQEETAQAPVGFNSSELDELSRVTSFESQQGDFREVTLTGAPIKAPKENIEMLLDVDLDVSIELGRSSLTIKRILELAPGAVVELDRMAGEPVDLLVNNKVVAKGEVVVIDESFGIRIVSLVSPEERIKSLR